MGHDPGWLARGIFAVSSDIKAHRPSRAGRPAVVGTASDLREAATGKACVGNAPVVYPGEVDADNRVLKIGGRTGTETDKADSCPAREFPLHVVDDVAPEDSPDLAGIHHADWYETRIGPSRIGAIVNGGARPGIIPFRRAAADEKP